MNPTPVDISIVALAVLLASALFGPEVAHVVGPYVVIVLASTIGASFALARRKVDEKLAAAWFFLRVNGLAILLTVALAAAVSGYFEELSERVLLAPIAFTVGFIGDEWPQIMRWAGGKVNDLVDALIKLKGGGNG